MNDLISIIIPVYNTDATLLNSCINSVINQSYTNLEIIVVDDGSKEPTRIACDNLKSIDSRIKVIHKENGGVSKARNLGTQEATGDFIMYVDSDDLFADFAVEEAMKAKQLTDADFVFGALKKIDSHSEFDCNIAALDNLDNIRVYKDDSIDILRKAFVTQRVEEFRNLPNDGIINRGPYVRLIKASIAKSVPFDETLVIGEDVEWNMRLLNKCNSICFVPNIWYGYLMYQNSSLNKYYGNRIELLDNYLTKLYGENKEYFDKHLGEYGINMAVSFYRMLTCEYMSAECKMSKRKKVKTVKKILKKWPWKLLCKKEVFKALSTRYRILVIASKFGLEFDLLKLWGQIK